VLKPEYFRDITTACLISTDSFESLIWLHKDKDPEVLDALKGKAKELPNGELKWEEVDRLVYHCGHLYIPPDLGLQQEALRQCHNAPAVGHPGQNQILEEVLHYYWWPGVEKFVCKYVAGCKTCAQGKPAAHPRGPLQPLDIHDGPWQVIGVNLVGPLPLLGGHDMILVYVDHFTKQAHFIPTHSTITAEGITDMHIKHIFPLHRTPDKIISDRGPQFAA
jgi:hypothetical protein